MRSMNEVFANLPVTVFEAMSQLARDNDAINLGQGFPDDPGPEDIRRAAADAVMDGYNQYPSMMGIPELRQAIATHYAHWHDVTLDPMTEVMVTSGGTEALTSAILAVVEPGDEVVAFQPVYDSAPGAAGAAALAADGRGAAGRVQPQDQGGSVQ
jgi:N-succinyldiaminopimelate aminotransferase